MFDNARDNRRAEEPDELLESLKAAIDSSKASARLMELILKKLDRISQVEAASGEKKSWLQRFGVAKSDSEKRFSDLEEAVKSKDNEIASLNLRIKEERSELEKRDAEIKGLQSGLDAARVLESELKAENARLAKDSDAIKRELAAAREAYSRLREMAPPDLAEVVQILRAAPQAFMDKIRLYYNIDDPLVFLSQCGKRALIEQLWKLCSDAVYDGHNPENIADFLKLVVERHNLANPDEPLVIYTPEIASRYDYDAQDRAGSDGERIDSVLLPGLSHKKGSPIVKALVRLTR